MIRSYARNRSKTNFFVNTELITASDKYDSNGNPLMVEWVAGGYGVIASSVDGYNWSPLTSLDSIFGVDGGNVAAIAWNGSIWLAGGKNSDNSKAVIAYSPDGINWTNSNSLVDIFGSRGIVTSIAWNGSLWLAGGDGYTGREFNKAVIAYSPDGKTWTDSLDSTFGYGNVYAIAWNGSLWVAGGYNNDFNKAVIANSADGINWSSSESLDSTFGDGFVIAIAWNGSLWVAGGRNNNTDKAVIAYSPDGINWLPSSDISGIFGSGDVYVRAIAWNGSLWLAGGSRTLGGGVYIAVIAYSADGINWSSSESLDSTFGSGGGYVDAIAAVTAIAWNGSRWLAGGYKGGTKKGVSVLAYSSDGISWFPLSDRYIPSSINCIASTRGLVPLTGALPNTLLCNSQGKTVKAKGNTFVKVAPVNSSSESDSFFFKLEDHKFASLIR